MLTSPATRSARVRSWCGPDKRNAEVKAMHVGRSKRSMLLLAARNAHLFIFAPALGSDSTGVTLRMRRAGGWTHYRVIVCQRNHPGYNQRRRHTKRHGQRFMARPTLTLIEIARWRTAPGTYDRTGLKSYLRVKLSPGGRSCP